MSQSEGEVEGCLPLASRWAAVPADAAADAEADGVDARSPPHQLPLLIISLTLLTPLPACSAAHSLPLFPADERLMNLHARITLCVGLSQSACICTRPAAVPSSHAHIEAFMVCRRLLLRLSPRKREAADEDAV